MRINILQLRIEMVRGISPRDVIQIFIFMYVFQLLFVYHQLSDAHNHERVWLQGKSIRYKEIPTMKHENVYNAVHETESEKWRIDFLKMATRGLNSTPASSQPLENKILGPTHIQQVAAGVWHRWEPGGVASTFLQYVTKPSAFCRKLIKVGGTSCLRRVDGDKVVCMDPRLGAGGVRRLSPSSSASCLVLSVGVGHDLSFDRAMARLACRVHAFDDDRTYKSWSRYQGPGLSFHRGRLGTQTRRFTFCDLGKGASSCRSYRHYTLQEIRTRLGYGNAPIHYLKVDIEGAEWDVLHQALQKGWLKEVKQLAVEVSCGCWFMVVSVCWISSTSASFINIHIHL
ncbi:probable methyltransferase-like protein 24 isoform X2 [Panulirus ornatus]|uniref:probable methyltransferase-like protein 24 isoform X2 n=1 Tax=Panulirus ornatus TaxID=150431 RepID=UPI003A83FBF8